MMLSGRGLNVRVLVQMLCAQLLWGRVGGSELTFELPDNAKQCFYEDITIGTKCTLEFQVRHSAENQMAPHTSALRSVYTT